MLSTLLVPRSIAQIRVVCRENKVAIDWMNRFLPMLRFGSPDLGFEFQRLSQQLQASAANDAADPEEPALQSTEAELEAQEEADVENKDPQECIEIHFADGSYQSLNLQLYVSSHQVMQRILDIDADKAASS